MAQQPKRLLVPDDVAALLRTMHPDIKRKVREALRVILPEPDAGKPLHDELEGLRSFRIGQLRVVFRRRPEAVTEVVAIGPRKHIYEDTYRRLKRRRQG